MLSDRTLGRVAALAASFRAGRPFKHVVIDGFLRPGACERLLEEFPPYEERFRAENGGKAEHPDLSARGPAFRSLDALLRSKAFLAFLSRATGIGGIRHDPAYFGGGAHEIRDGMDNSIHLDFNRLPDRRLFRRLNLFLYLNPGWRREWGGLLELHSDPLALGADRTRAISPRLNRAVLVEAGESSWHGVTRVRLPASERGRSRRSIAVYYYTTTPPPDKPKERKTLYFNRLLPGLLPAGHVLRPADLEELRWLELPPWCVPGRRLRAADVEELRRLAEHKTIAVRLRAESRAARR